MATKKENDREKKYDWVIFAQSYFLLARLACQELLSAREKKHSKNKNLDTPYQPADLYVSILFNIKHGIEVFIKALSLFAYGEYRKGHDIHQLFTEVKQEISKLKLTLPQKVYYDAATQDDIDNSSKDLDQIEFLVSYFYNLELLKSKIGRNYKINDAQNDFLRYPENKATDRVDWGTVLIGKISAVDVEQISEKADELYELFNKAGYLHAVLNRCKMKIR